MSNNNDIWLPPIFNIAGTSGNDVLINFTNDYIGVHGFAGDDTIVVSGNNTKALFGGDGNDTLYAGSSTNIAFGDNGNDIIIAVGGNDTLSGGNGNDLLIGGGGGDNLTGGSGNDAFVWQNTSESNYGSTDRVLDFKTGDKLVLTSIDANTNIFGDQAFNFIGSASFTGVAGEMHTWINSGKLTVSVDTNGDKLADFAFNVNSDHTLTANDFVL